MSSPKRSAVDWATRDAKSWVSARGPMTIENRVQCAADAGAKFWDRVEHGKLTTSDVSAYITTFFKVAAGPE